MSICGMFGYPVLERFASLSNDDFSSLDAEGQHSELEALGVSRSVLVFHVGLSENVVYP